jgi:hypothetical protein
VSVSNTNSRASNYQILDIYFEDVPAALQQPNTKEADGLRNTLGN